MSLGDCDKTFNYVVESLSKGIVIRQDLFVKAFGLFLMNRKLDHAKYVYSELKRISPENASFVQKKYVMDLVMLDEKV